MRGLLSRIRCYRPGPWAFVVLAVGVIVGLCLAERLFRDPPDPAAYRAQVATMDRRIPELKLDAARLEDVLKFLQDISGLKIAVDWDGLAAQNVRPDTPVTLRLRDVPFRKGLALVLQNAGVKSGYHFDRHGQLVIGTEPEVFERRYVVRDLLIDLPYDYDIPENNSVENERDFWALRDEIIKLIETTIAPDTWHSQGGRASIRYERGVLVVSQSYEHHQQLRNLMNKLRETRSMPFAYFERGWYMGR